MSFSGWGYVLDYYWAATKALLTNSLFWVCVGLMVSGFTFGVIVTRLLGG